MWKHEQTIAIIASALLGSACRLAYIVTGSASCIHKWVCHQFLQVIALRLNVKLSPDQERQLLESSMVPIDEQEDHVLTIETTSAVPAPVAPVKASAPPAILGPTASGMNLAAEGLQEPCCKAVFVLCQA